jgi:hypothetical protein
MATGIEIDLWRERSMLAAESIGLFPIATGDQPVGL